MIDERVRASLTVAVLVLTATHAWAQKPSLGNADSDGLVVPTFSIPKGAVSIANSGEGVISIPLAVPPGVRGMAPKLSLSYSSGGADVGLGPGWSIALGHPDAVRRSTRHGVPSYDNATDVFTYAGQDLFSTDGKTYKTKIDSFQRIEFANDQWVVWNQDGTKLEYGERSVIFGKGTHTWHLSRVTDTVFGNYMRFEYEGEPSSRRLTLIRYTYSTPPGQLQEVDFVWQDRTDKRERYDVGGWTPLNVRLDRIETRSDRFIRSYELIYADEDESHIPAPLTGYSLLAEVREQSFTGTPSQDDVAIALGKFSYQDRRAGWPSAGPKPPLPFVKALAAQGVPILDIGVRLADVNGDGFTDLVRSANAYTNDYPNGVYFHNGTTWNTTPDPSWTVPWNFVWISDASSSGASGIDEGVRLVDANCDGLVDLVQSKPFLNQVLLNNKHGWDTQGPNGETYSLPDGVQFVDYESAPLPSRNGSVQLEDVNGDGCVDILVGGPGDTPEERKVYINNQKTGWDDKSATWRLPVNFRFPYALNQGLSFIDTGVRLADINGDGLTDILQWIVDFTSNIDLCGQQPSNKCERVFLNTGAGWEQEENTTWKLPALAYVAIKPGLFGKVLHEFGVQITDIDSDGFPDIFWKGVTRIRWQGTTLIPTVEQFVFLNNRSNGFVNTAETASPWNVPIDVVGFSVSGGPCNCPNNFQLSDNGFRALDVDADGLTDLVAAIDLKQLGGNMLSFGYLGNRGPTHGIADLLYLSGDALGGSSRLLYGRATGFGLSSGQMPFGRTVVKSLTQYNGMGEPKTSTALTYERGLYDNSLDPVTSRRRRDFRGFEKVTETYADTNQRERVFHVTEEGKKGLEKSEALRDDKVFFSHNSNYVSTADVTVPGVFKTVLDNEWFYHYHQDDESRNVLRRKLYLVYDAYGNPKEVREAGFGNIVDRRTATDREYRVTTGSYLVLPTKIRKYSGLATLVTEDLFYDSRGALERTVVTDDELKRKATNLAPYAPTVIETKYQYYDNGNLKKEINGRAVTEAGRTDIPTAGFTTEYEYAANGELFPSAMKRGHLDRSFTFDKGFGVLKDATDFAGNKAQYRYDKIGRLKAIGFPGSDPDSDPDVKVAYTLAVVTPPATPDGDYEVDTPAFMKVEEKLDTSRTRTRYEYLDGLGRPKARLAGQVDGNWTVSGLTQYDNRGRPATVYDPFRSTFFEFEKLQPGSRYTTYTYEDDKVRRATFQPSQHYTENLYLADAVCRRDENGTFTLERYDAFGMLVEVGTDAKEGCPAGSRTLYSYDKLGRLASTLDARKLSSQYFFDARGLLRGFKGPDAPADAPLWNGYQLWNDYDAQGNLLYHRSLSDVALYSFDDVDRQIELRVSRDGGASQPVESTFIYDQAKDEGGMPIQNGKGNLTTVIGWGTIGSPSTKTSNALSYDQRGRLKEERFRFGNLHPSLALARVEYTYDRENRISTVRDPRDRVIGYSRNALGQIDNRGAGAITHSAALVTGGKAIQDVNYDERGHVGSITYANGKEDIFTYDSRGRMETISGSGPLELKYEYYPNGNLKLEHDLERPFALDFTYYPSNELWQVTGNAFGQTLGITYAYDGTGNISTVTGAGSKNATYKYGDAAPSNRLTSVEFAGKQPLSVQYDISGRGGNIVQLFQITSVPPSPPAFYRRDFSYDGLGRLRTFGTESKSGSVDYDGRGRKVRRSAAGRSEIYFHGVDGNVLSTYEPSTDKWTNYVYADGRRVANAQSVTEEEWDQLSFIHGDRLGSARAITVAGNAPPVWRGDYLPFGAAICPGGQACPQGGGDNFQFTGQELDETLGFYDYGARYYHQDLGRFLQIDSYLGDPAEPRTLNRYSYALNNPLAYVDPTGQAVCDPTEEPGCSQNMIIREQTQAPTTGDAPAASDQSAQPGPTVLEGVTVYAPRELPRGTRWNENKNQIESTGGSGGVLDAAGKPIVQWDASSGEWGYSSAWNAFYFGFFAGDDGYISAEERVRANLGPKPTPDLGCGGCTTWGDLTTQQKVAFTLMQANFYLTSYYAFAPGPALNVPANANRKGPNWGMTKNWTEFPPFNPPER